MSKVLKSAMSCFPLFEEDVSVGALMCSFFDHCSRDDVIVGARFRAFESSIDGSRATRVGWAVFVVGVASVPPYLTLSDDLMRTTMTIYRSGDQQSLIS